MSISSDASSSADVISSITPVRPYRPKLIRRNAFYDGADDKVVYTDPCTTAVRSFLPETNNQSCAMKQPDASDLPCMAYDPEALLQRYHNRLQFWGVLPATTLRDVMEADSVPTKSSSKDKRRGSLPPDALMELELIQEAIDSTVESLPKDEAEASLKEFRDECSKYQYLDLLKFHHVDDRIKNWLHECT
ncbi:hypothetical protein K491DRAFT_715826 [Lophiostoma macrostomum CBS 122681]|uniref:Uncharacterized protein n=1 Tax=Lophiostoma macrostomum CBS 122681 TaxID=1314788 RepID=A0A6A6TAP6_9PLEO|nr:hypothetical protein K491DRAFT_715826 [Lophiostoma macrostomum CBS 122681]